MLGIKKTIKLWLFKAKWRKLNKHNFTIANTNFPEKNVIIGKKTYGELNIYLGENLKRHLIIGHFCSIAPDVKFIINPHNYHFFSSWPFQRYEYDEFNYEWEKKLDIVVEDDVWIGQGAIILGGAKLRKGCIVGAGSVVSGEVPEYAIFAGGKIIKFRFPPEICKKLSKIDYNTFDEKLIRRIKGWHKIEITEENVEDFLTLVPTLR